MKACFFLISLIGSSTTVFASKDDSGFSNRFQPNGLSYAMLQRSELSSTADGETKEDDYSIEARYAFKYNLYDCRYGNSVNKKSIEINKERMERYFMEVEGNKENLIATNVVISLPTLVQLSEINWNVCKEDSFSKFSFNFSFTGEFDFYAGTRHSGPVINRTSNPAFHGVFDFNNDYFGYVDAGIEHRSNGQVTEIDETDQREGSSTIGQFNTQIAYQNGDYEFFDTLSRGSNYLSFTTGKVEKEQLSWSASYKLYIDETTEINWGPLANQDVSIEDYDLIRLYLEDTIGFKNSHLGVNRITISAEYTFGKELGKTDSIDLNLIIPIQPGVDELGFSLPLLFRLHHGPMERLSDYTNSVTSFGVGIALNY
jgi:hypothetical protein